MSGDRTKLPKWAQHEMDVLEANAERWRSRATVGPEGSNTFVAYGGGCVQPLGSSPRIQFGQKWDERFDVRLDGDELIVQGGDGVLIRPVAGNVVRLRIGR